ncbi:hypothetical protein JOE66_000222 [Subtercola frigoramans]|uniref:Uncharacterized protein n=1 Tax=Subtercola frigoramans TaxID=120298 RepID=A0ABS2L0J6_9MICO|nr:hypothetical protein [Subtercola frigoramans]
MTTSTAVGNTKSMHFVRSQRVGVGITFGRQTHLYGGLLAWLFGGFATDFINSVAGVRPAGSRTPGPSSACHS